MDIVHIDKNKFKRMVLKAYSEVSKTVIRINIYTIVRSTFVAAEKYSNTIQALHSEAIKALVISSIPNTLQYLQKKEVINEKLFKRLANEYKEDYNRSIPDAVTEFMYIISEKDIEHIIPKNDKCIIS